MPTLARLLPGGCGVHTSPNHTRHLNAESTPRNINHLRILGLPAPGVTPHSPAGLQHPTPDTVISTSAGVAATATDDEMGFDREFAFLSADVDSLIIVSWFFRSRRSDAPARQEMRAWWMQDGAEAVLAEESAEIPRACSPWRIVPGAAVRLPVGPEARIESLLLRAPPEELETALGELVAKWTAPASESVRVYRDRTTFPAGRVDGIVIEISRRWEADEDRAPGVWVFLHSGADLPFFMAGEAASENIEAPISSQGWSRTPLADARWPNLAMPPEDVRPFETTRRDIPVRWALTKADGEVSGTPEAVGSHVTAGQSDGPILPLFGLLEVAGTLEVQGEAWPVSAGLIRHAQR